MNATEFKPTKQWIKEHAEHPKDCKLECHCICNDWVLEYGFCVGLRPDSKETPDIVSFCCSYYDPSTQEPATHQFLWHPQEAGWIATILSLAVVESWGMMPQYRKLMKKLENDRGIGSHKNNRSNNERH